MTGICINDIHEPDIPDFRLKHGDLYELCESILQDFYWLPELQQGYKKWRFVILPDLRDEIKIINKPKIEMV